MFVLLDVGRITVTSYSGLGNFLCIGTILNNTAELILLGFDVRKPYDLVSFLEKQVFAF